EQRREGEEKKERKRRRKRERAAAKTGSTRRRRRDVARNTAAVLYFDAAKPYAAVEALTEDREHVDPKDVRATEEATRGSTMLPPPRRRPRPPYTASRSPRPRLTTAPPSSFLRPAGFPEDPDFFDDVDFDEEKR
ncbi:unnamed protein product, partial [Urochloa humidicola]